MTPAPRSSPRARSAFGAAATHISWGLDERKETTTVTVHQDGVSPENHHFQLSTKTG